MTALADAYVAVKPDTSRFGADLRTGLRRVDTDKAGRESGRKFGGAFSGTVKGMLGGAAILGALTSAIGFLRDANAEARESQKVGATTAQIIKSTGGAAKVSADQVGALSMAISNKTGMDDEAIQSGANLLLTFKNVRNEVGAGANIFDRATGAAVDLSAAGFGSVGSASKMLGKALNDPLKGISALSRAGVTFTQQQKDQIRTLVESGNVLGAQKLIMKEVESQVGGVAAASATATEKMSTAWNNFKEQIGTALLPVLDGIANLMTRHVIPALSSVVSWLSDKIPAAIAVIRPAFSQMAAVFRASSADGSHLLGTFSSITGFIRSEVVPRIRELAAAFTDRLRTVLPILMQIGQALGSVFRSEETRRAFGTITSVITSGLDLIKAITVRGTQVIRFIWDRWGADILAVVKTSLKLVVSVIGPVLKIIAGVFKTLAAVLNGDWSAAWGGLRQILQGNLDLVYALLRGAVAIIGGLLKLIWAPIIRSARDAWMGALEVIRNFWTQVGRTVSAGAAAVATPVRNAWNTVRDATVSAFTAIGRFLSGIFRTWVAVVKIGITAALVPIYLANQGLRDVTLKTFRFIVDRVITPIWRQIRSVFTSVMGVIRRLFAAWWADLRSNASAVWNAVYRTVIAPVWQRIRALFSTVMGVIRAAWSTWWGNIRTTASTIFNAIRNVISTVWNTIRSRWTTAQSGVRTSWSGFWGGIKTTASNAIGWVHTRISTVLGRIRSAFQTAKSNIASVWAGVKGVVSAPIEWVRNHVYNSPLVPVWNRVAGLVNGPKLSTYASGGVIPGYTPGKDNHVIAVGGGEAVMRPEWTRAAGKDYINSANKAARHGGVEGASKFIADAGLPPLPGFAGGGIVGWIKDKLGGAGAAISGFAGKIKDFVLGGLRSAAAAILNPLKGVIDRNMPNSGVGNTVGAIGKKGIDLLLDKIGSADAAAVAASGGGQGDPGGPPGTGSRRLVTWKGGTFTERFRNTLVNAQRLAGVNIPVIQGGFSHRVAASGTSHYGDAIDTRWVPAILSGLRRARVAAWHRTPAQGFPHHIHGVPLPGAGYPGGSGIWQAQDYLRGGNGLAMGGLVKGGRGGVLAHIGEGANDELVTPLPKNWKSNGGGDKIDRLIAAIERHGLNAPQINIGDIINPREETLSQSTNKILQRAASLPLV